MNFRSTRGLAPVVGFSDAVRMGLAPDGGLYIPEILPDFGPYLSHWESLSYPELFFSFIREFATDIPENELNELASASHTRFADPRIAPLRKLSEQVYLLELYHGPTLAFKDFALQFLGRLYERQIRESGQSINVLGATSGDTGAAAIHGLLNVAGARIFILYPDGRISPLQERQMTCTGAQNVYPLAIQGSFDDAQAALKDTFADQEFRSKHHLSAVNSINLARILAQCVYYFHAWLNLPTDSRESVEFVVPTGNFGNILAGWMAQKMGLPLRTLRVATNQNDILYRLFQSGLYEIHDVCPSLAPSMDIQVASNFERYLYFALKEDSGRLRTVMESFKDTGRVDFGSEFPRDIFTTSRTGDREIPEIIARVYEKFDCVIDPHTACGFKELNPERISVVLGTAHPAKFPDTIRAAVGLDPRAESLDALKRLAIRKYCIPSNREAIQAFILEHAA